MIKIASTLFIVIYVLTIAFMKQQTTNAIAKTRAEERLVCENTIAEANTKSTQTTIKTIKRFNRFFNLIYINRRHSTQRLDVDFSNRF